MSASLTWIGSSFNSWVQPANWSTGTVPAPGDDVLVASGIASIDGLALDGLAIMIGSTEPGAGAGLQMVGAVTLAPSSRIAGTPDGSATILVTSSGSWEIDGSVSVSGTGEGGETLDVTGDGFVTVGATGQVAVADGYLSIAPGLLSRGALSVSDGTLVIVGAAYSTGTITVGAGGLFRDDGGLQNTGGMAVQAGGILLDKGGLINSGSLLVDGGSVSDEGGLTNGGTIALSAGGTLYDEGGLSGIGAVALSTGGWLVVDSTLGANQSVGFADAYGTLSISYPTDFQGSIQGFRTGDLLDLSSTKADSAILSDNLLTVYDLGQVVATIGMTAASGASVQFTTRDDGFGTLLLSSDATRTWTGSSGSWFDAASWITAGTDPASAPLAGDSVFIKDGTADLDNRNGALQATLVHLSGSQSDPATLRLDGATIEKTSSVELDGSARYGQIGLSGDNTLNGHFAASSIDGTLLIDVSNPAVASSLTVNGAIEAGAGAAIKISGASLINNGLIDALGRVDVASSVTLSGDGLFEIDHGGIVSMGGAVPGQYDGDDGQFTGQAFVFEDGTGRLRIDDLGEFNGKISGFQQGDVIELSGQVVTSLSYDGAAGALSLTLANGTTNTLHIDTSTYYENVQGSFLFKSDGNGGTTLRFQATAPTIVDVSMPVAAVGYATDQVSFRQILINAFGEVPTGYASYTLYSTVDEREEGYWAQPTQAPPGTAVSPAWFINDGQNNEQVNAYTVQASQIDNVYFQVGNAIASNAWFQVTAAGTDASPTELVNYHMWGVDPSASTFSPSGSTTPAAPTADTQLASIDAFNSAYPDTQNTTYCPWIADDAAAGGGATMPWQNESTDPDDNQEGGFWRIVHNGLQDPTKDWYTKLSAGDIVRMGWGMADDNAPYADTVGQHTTSIYKIVQDPNVPDQTPRPPVVTVWDNNDYRNDGSIDYIGMHDATYWDATVPQSVTIYRIDPKGQYLIEGTGTGEFIQGSVFNNLIEPGAGKDTIAAGIGNNEISGTAADLNGDRVTDFHPGDWLDLTDLGFPGATSAYDAASGVLTVTSGSQSTSITLPASLAGSFALADDGNGGTVVTLACYVPGTRIGVPDRDDGVPIERLRIGDLVRTAAGAARPVRWIGRRAYGARFAAANPDVHPVLIRAGALADGVPERDLRVSPRHAMLIDGMLVPAELLVNGVSVRQPVPAADVEYIHLELDSHDAILADGAASESFVDDDSRDMFQNAHEFRALYPDEPRRAARYCAPRLQAGDPVLEGIRRVIDRRAGLGGVEPLRGGIVGWHGGALLGWAQNPERPDAPVCVEVLLDGAVAAHALADLFRPELRAAGLGSGCHGFRVELPFAAPHRAVTVRRAGDGALLAFRPAERPAEAVRRAAC